MFEPHIAPTIERWAEDFLEKRRARRGDVSVPVSSTRGPGNGDSRGSTGADVKKKTPAGEDSIQLEDLHEWRNEVHRNASATGVRRRTRVVPDTDEGNISTTIDEVCLSSS